MELTFTEADKFACIVCAIPFLFCLRSLVAIVLGEED